MSDMYRPLNCYASVQLPSDPNKIYKKKEILTFYFNIINQLVIGN